MVLVFLASGLIMYRLFILSYVRHPGYLQTAEAQSQNVSNITVRGNIYLQDPESRAESSQEDPDLYLAATNKKFPLVYIVPSEIDKNNSSYISDVLGDIIGVSKEEILNVILSGSKNTKVLAKRLNDEQAEKIQNLGQKGLELRYESERYYPGDEMAANVLGFFGYDQNGQSGRYGLELYYDDELFGRKFNINYFGSEKLSGFFDSLKDIIFGEPAGEESETGQSADRPADIILTIDRNVQLFVESKLDEVIKRWNATGGSAIVQDPNTGRIMAMADRPSFNPNFYYESPIENFISRSSQQIFEPGSSFKPITMAIGLDLGKITPQTIYTDTGSVDIAGYKIKNFSEKIFGQQTMSQVLEKSINTGAMYVQQLVGNDEFLNYIINMGFGQKTGIDLPGEVSGDISNLYTGRKINYLTTSFGQGIAVTPIQLINTYSAIANGGKLMKPYIVEKIIERGGSEKIIEPEIISIPISEKTSAKLRVMLTSVVDNGFDKARITGYDIAGKTGTAQIPDEKGGYSEDEFIHDFVGFAPASNPRFVILLKIDKPRGINFASDSLSSTFKDITQFLINYYNIPPTR